jgi:uncharacterized damage-inducible protein DinB
MSKAEIVRALFDYNEYANNYLLGETGKLSEEEFSRDCGASWGSIEANLAHVSGAQIVWLSRWGTGRDPEPPLEMEEFRGHAILRGAFQESHASLRVFVEQASDEDLEASLHYKNHEGKSHRRRLWQLMVHLVNHGTHHRSEVCMALAAMGRAVKDLDYHYFEMERAQ